MSAIRVIQLPQNGIFFTTWQKRQLSTHTLTERKGHCESIGMVRELDGLSGDSVQLTLARTELGSKLAKVDKSRNFGGKLPATHTPLPLFHLIPLPWLSFPSPHMLGQVLIMIRVGYGSFP